MVLQSVERALVLKDNNEISFQDFLKTAKRAGSTGCDLEVLVLPCVNRARLPVNTSLSHPS